MGNVRSAPYHSDMDMWFGGSHFSNFFGKYLRCSGVAPGTRALRTPHGLLKNRDQDSIIMDSGDLNSR